MAGTWALLRASPQTRRGFSPLSVATRVVERFPPVTPFRGKLRIFLCLLLRDVIKRWADTRLGGARVGHSTPELQQVPPEVLLAHPQIKLPPLSSC